VSLEIQVPGIGPSNARLAIIGEAPGGDEVRTGIPFSGASGRIVEECCECSGFDLRDVYRTNVVKVRPPNNDIRSLHLLGLKIEDYLPLLEQEINALKPNCILAVGGTALKHLAGLDGITKYRGSIVRSNYGPKLVGTLHPAGILHAESSGSKLFSWKDLTYIKWDFKRAYEESHSSYYSPPRRNLIICRSYVDLYQFLRRHSSDRIVSVDIETFHTIPICIAFAFDRNEAISVPLFENLPNFQVMTRSDLLHCWHDICMLMSDPYILKIGQNFKFDQRLLDSCVDGRLFFGIKTTGLFFDTLLGFKTLYPELPGRLEFQTSVLTKEVYYKEEGRGFNPKKDRFDRLLLYNAKDAVVTFECYEEIARELDERGLADFFYSRVMPLHPFYSRLESRGVKRDDFQQKFLLSKYELQREELQEELDDKVAAILGEKTRAINVNSNAKTGDIPWLVYEVLKLPFRETTDEKALDALMRNHCKDEEKHRILELVLQLRKVRKVIGTYIEAEPDYRGRLLTSVQYPLETGRSATRMLKPPVTTKNMGAAFQTLTKHGEVGSDIRSMYIPDPGYVFLSPDLKGAEARVVAVLAKDEKLQKIFTFEVDIHRVTKGWIDGTCPDLTEFFNEKDEERCKVLAKGINSSLKSVITDEERQVGKKLRHAANYDVGKRTASEQIGCSEAEAGRFLTRVHETNQNIKGVFHKEIQEVLKTNNRTLKNPFGRERQFLNKWGPDLFREAYADIPQGTISDQTKFAAQRIEKRLDFKIHIFCESHDAFDAQVPISLVDETIRIMREEMEQPINFRKCTLSRDVDLIIPCEISFSDTNWEQMRKIA